MASKLLRRSGVAVGLVCDRLKWKPDLIVQAGIGLNHEEIDVLHREWPDSRIIGYEPHPDIAGRASVGTYPGRVVPKALGNSTGTAALRVKRRHKDGSSLLTFDRSVEVGRIIDVPLVTLDDEFSGHPDADTLLWLDCEGSELSVLRGGRVFCRNVVDVINVEMTPNPPGPGWPSTVEIHEELEGLGFLRQWTHTERGGQYDAIYTKPRLFNPRYCCCPFTIRQWGDR
jgi:FkbM family methyltransferase